MTWLEQVLRGIKSLQAKVKGTPSPRLPITPDLLDKMWQVWAADQHNSDNIMMWAAAALLCFFGFLRAGEITVLSDSVALISVFQTYMWIFMLTCNFWEFIQYQGIKNWSVSTWCRCVFRPNPEGTLPCGSGAIIHEAERSWIQPTI